MSVKTITNMAAIGVIRDFFGPVLGLEEHRGTTWQPRLGWMGDRINDHNTTIAEKAAARKCHK